MAILQGRRILIVEDEYFVAEAISQILEEAGAAVAGPIGWVEEAVSFVESEGSTLDAAVLDVSLHGRASYPIADALTAHGVRVLFVTGYDRATLAPAYRGHPRCEKPLKPEAILAALTATAR
jgi:DNA-binding response OmpR family regulator